MRYGLWRRLQCRRRRWRVRRRLWRLRGRRRRRPCAFSLSWRRPLCGTQIVHRECQAAQFLAIHGVAFSPRYPRQHGCCQRKQRWCRRNRRGSSRSCCGSCCRFEHRRHHCRSGRSRNGGRRRRWAMPIACALDIGQPFMPGHFPTLHQAAPEQLLVYRRRGGCRHRGGRYWKQQQWGTARAFPHLHLAEVLSLTRGLPVAKRHAAPSDQLVVRLGPARSRREPLPPCEPAQSRVPIQRVH